MQETKAISTSDIERLAAAGQFTKVNGENVIGTGMVALFLFRDGGTAARRAAVLAIAQNYFQLSANNLRWRITEGECLDLHRTAGSPIEAAPTYTQLKAAWSYTFSAGTTMSEASPYEFGFICQPSWHPLAVSYLYLQLPLTFLNSDFLLRFQQIAALLHADQAYGGVGILQRPGSANAEPYGHLAYALAKRYPGFEFFSPWQVWESIFLVDAVRPPNWLTAVGSRYLQRLGGWQAVSGGFDPRIAIYKYDGGVIFQAGAKPDLGDAGPPELYRQIARALKPLRFSGNQPGFFGSSQIRRATFDAVNTSEWLARFD